MTLHRTRPEPLVVVHDVLQWAWRALCRFGRRMPWALVIVAFTLTMLSPFLAVTFGEFARKAGAEGLIFLGIMCMVVYLAVRIGRIYASRARAAKPISMKPSLARARRVDLSIPDTAELADEYGVAVALAAGAATPSSADAAVLRERARDLAARSTPPQWRSVRRRAEHEAAHVVVAHQLGAVINGVWATGDHRTIGGAMDSTVEGLGATGVQHEWASAVMALAGTVWDHDHGITDQGGRNDLNMVASLLTQVLLWGVKPDGYGGEMTYDALLTAASAQSHQILTDNDDLVHAIADRIEARPDETLTEQDLADLWERK